MTRMTEFRNGSVLAWDGTTHQLLPEHMVLVEGDTIREVRPATDAPHQSSADVIDVAGAVIAPGLIDAHVHFAADDEIGLNYAEAPDVVNERVLLAFLAHGITTVLCLHGSPEVQQLRTRVGSRELPGPRIYSSGPIHDDATMTRSEAVALAAAEHTAGYDFIKVYNELSLEAHEGFIQGGAATGLRTLGHVTRAVGWDGTLTSGQVAVAHIEEFVYTRFGYSLTATDALPHTGLVVEELPAFAEQVRRSGVAIITCLQTFKAIIRQSEDSHAWLERAEMELLPASVRADWAPDRNHYAIRFHDLRRRRRLQEAYWFQTRMTEALIAAGVPLIPGSDALVTGVVPGPSLLAELENLVVCGWSDADVLRAATADAARFIDPSRAFGRIETGARADLVVLGGNPLQGIRATNELRGVVAAGRWWERADLFRLLDASA